MAETDSRFGRVDVLVNAAALTDRGSILDTSPELFDRMFDINVRAPFFLMQAAAKIMRRQGQGGTIVNILSTSAYGGQPILAAYSASKGALGILTRNAAYALMRDGIRINGLNIGWMDTPGEHGIQARATSAAGLARAGRGQDADRPAAEARRGRQGHRFPGLRRKRHDVRRPGRFRPVGAGSRRPAPPDGAAAGVIVMGGLDPPTYLPNRHGVGSRVEPGYDKGEGARERRRRTSKRNGRRRPTVPTLPACHGRPLSDPPTYLPQSPLCSSRPAMTIGRVRPRSE